jgi:hypothetical protein
MVSCPAVEANTDNRLSPAEPKASTTSAIYEEETLTYCEPPPICIASPQGPLTIQLYRIPPNWFYHVLYKLTKFLYFEDNWDSYGSNRIDIECVASAVKVLMRISNLETPEPDVIPTSEGSVQIEWSENGFDIEIEIKNPMRLSWDFEELSTGFVDEGEEGILNGLERLKAYVERLAVR